MKPNNKEKQPQNTKTGPEPNATNTNQPPVAVMGTAKAHHYHCRQTNQQKVNELYKKRRALKRQLADS